MPYRLTAASAEEAGLVLSLDDALSLALENNLNLKKNLIDLSGAEYSAGRLWSEVFPTINASVGTSYGSPLFSGDGFSFDNKAANNARFGVNLSLNAGIPYSVRNIRLAHQINMLRYEDARNQLEIQITKMFYGLIAEKNNLDYLEDIFRLAETQLERNEISFRNGYVRELVVLQSRLGVENARYNLSIARASYSDSFRELLVMLGIHHDDPAFLAGEINIDRIEADANALISEYLPQRPDIISRMQEIDRLENIEKQVSLSNRAPSLDLSVTWSSSNFDPFADSLTGTATLSIPIDRWIPGTRASQTIRGARDSLEKARLDLQIAQDAAIKQIRSLTANLYNSWDSVEIARFSAGIAEQNYQLTDLGFRNGTVESLVLEDARNNYANARQRLLQSELYYLNLTLDLSAALNMDWKELTRAYGVSSEKR
ncbi:MAG: TolC family protein [Treponema sp.]|nr:TolC family protein [Treponema sp.]